jgi:membrane dipeptidase
MKRREIIKYLSILPISGNIITAKAAVPALVGEMTSLSELPLLSDDKLFVMDGHIHVMSRQLLQNLDIGDKYPDGSVDLPRMIEGGLNAVFFSVYTPEAYYPGRFETKNTFRVVELALYQIEKNDRLIELALTASDLERISRKGKIAAFLDLEGPFDLDGDLNLLRALYRLGVRSLQLTAHNETNGFIDSCYGTRLWGGINDLGRTVIREMNRLGMLINVAHASDEAILQTVEASKHPVVYSHGGFRGIVDNKRCISDVCAKAVAAKGGVIGIQFGSSFNNPKYADWIKSQNPIEKPKVIQLAPNSTIEDIDKQVELGLPFVFKGVIPDEYWMGVDQLAKVVDYGVRLLGEDHVALGSDFDGGPPLPREIKDVSDYPEMIKALQNLGYSDQRVQKICGLNWLRVIREVTEG